MIVKPNRETNQKAIYEPIDIEYFLKTSKISFVDKNKATENGTLA